ncbi:DNA polymerase subunit beta [Alkalihalophilus pseudofirmus]|uniref:type VII toxin-antitoxin system MntA family adenylyltransferase antitoxin n=1 Tax=Alkalihalobacterium alkalinitrilicum TaxID=427920 RepID=UPI00094C1993|nr:nucleotidyltransferase domain-containing protein [Alkalihalobacterium alkalinitrilicum]OLO40668.1 DNA polymerase subunit beta [Alkalihalophilus pseudofirmus]
MEKLVVDELVPRLNPSIIYLFGSYAKGTATESSDIDIAYFSETSLTNYERFILAQYLADLVKKEVDLVDIKQASTVFQAQIVGLGKVIYCSNEKQRHEFEMLTLKMYAKLNEERKPILDQIKESGKIYE